MAASRLSIIPAYILFLVSRLLEEFPNHFCFLLFTRKRVIYSRRDQLLVKKHFEILEMFDCFDARASAGNPERRF